jgi:anti-anti-sigma factor
VCWSYESDDAHSAFLLQYFTAGLRAHERLLYLADPDQTDAALAALTRSGLDVGALLRDRSLSTGDVTDAYLSSGSLLPDIRLLGHAVLVQQALDDGFAGLRVCSEITELLGRVDVRDQWCGYELRADVLISGLPSVVVCACDARVVGPVIAGDVASVHSHLAGTITPETAFRLHAGSDGPSHSPSLSLSLSGEVDASSAERVGRWLRDALGDLPRPIVDVSGLEFIDAAGMWALLDSAHAHPDGLCLRGTSPQFRRVWSVCGYDAIGSVHLN